MTNIAREQEIWKQHPDYDFIEASNLGRVRTKDRYVPCRNGGKRLFKGRVLKQQLNKRGYVYVHFRVNGKQIHLLVHRAVATSFLPNPNNLPEVNHKDNNPKNNSVSNLEWCTSQYNTDYKKNFGTTSAQVLGRPVYAVNLGTGKVLWFETQSEAARQLCVNLGSLNGVVKGKLNQVGGYWFTEDKSEITEEKIREIKAKMHFYGGVIAINIETLDVFWFGSRNEAVRQLGVNGSHVSAVVKGKLNKTGGYWFC